jgi:hypothetical protein
MLNIRQKKIERHLKPIGDLLFTVVKIRQREPYCAEFQAKCFLNLHKRQIHISGTIISKGSIHNLFCVKNIINKMYS